MLNLIIIGGRKQKAYGTWTGGRELEEILRVEFREYCLLNVRISHYEHANDWINVAADLINLHRKYKTQPFYTCVFSYSWGVGEGTVQLAKCLKPYGLRIHTLVSCDGIYKSFFITGNWRSLFGNARILMPDNVDRIIPFAQKQSIPMGRGIATTRNMEPMTYLEYNHVEMDSAPEWHAKCIEVAHDVATFAVPTKLYIPTEAPDTELVKEKAKNGNGTAISPS